MIQSTHTYIHTQNPKTAEEKKMELNLCQQLNKMKPILIHDDGT